MNLLPKTKIEFSSEAYWEDFFQKRKHAFEWYGEYLDLCEILEKYCKLDDKILMSGCGNSNLSEEMFDVGYHNIVNIDISVAVLKQMNAKSNGRMPYLKMNMMKTTFNDDNFNVIIDKGTLDAIFADNNIEIAMGVRKMFTEILRVLKVVGRYICVTLAQDHILNELLSFFPKWCFVRVHEIKMKEVDTVSGLGSKLPVFAFVCTKMKSELSSPVLEMIFSGNVKVEKFTVIEEMKRNIKTLQDFAFVKSKLESSSLDEEITVELWTNDVSLQEPRYSLTVIDIGKNKLSAYNGDFAVFIVPNGRENNTMFATNTGRKNLAKSAGFTRLAIAYLHRGHVYKDLEEIKCELSDKVMDLAPSHVDKKVQIPFLSTSSDIGNRVVVYEGESSFYGKFVVEDVQSEQSYYYRQLIIAKSTDQLQTKTRLMSVTNKKKKSKKRIPDHRYLMQRHEKSMLAGLLFISSLDFQKLEKMNVLIFGLHNVSFINYLLYLFPDLHVTCIDVDSNMLDVYRTWFSLDDTDRFTFIHKDLFCFSHDCQQTLYDVVIVDRTSLKDSRNLSEEVFTKAKCVLKKHGVLMYIQTYFFNSIESFKRYVNFFHFESEVDEALVQYYVKCDISLNDAWEQAKLKCNELVDYIMSMKKGFYEKQEWSSLIDLVETFLLCHRRNSLQ